MGWLLTGGPDAPSEARFTAGAGDAAGQCQSILEFLSGVDTGRLRALSVELPLPDGRRGLLALLPAIADVIGRRHWPVLEAFALSVGAESARRGYDFAPDTASPGADGSVFSYVDEPTAERLWRAMPALRRLELTGHWLFPVVSHPRLETVELRGVETVLNGGYSYWDRPCGLRLPELRRLTVAFMNDGCGAGLPSVLLDFPTDSLPRLRHLDLADSYPFEPGSVVGDDGAEAQWVLFDSLLESDVLDRLDTLAVPCLGFTGDTHNGRPVLRLLEQHGDRFRRLKRLTLRALDHPLEESAVRRLLPRLRIGPPATGLPERHG
ncbi:hypothetical protein ACWDR0_01500 [Streptomyces sp. NPDC003691]